MYIHFPPRRTGQRIVCAALDAGCRHQGRNDIDQENVTEVHVTVEVEHGYCQEPFDESRDTGLSLGTQPPFRTIMSIRKHATTTQTIKDTTDASGPKLPPVSHSGPE